MQLKKEDIAKRLAQNAGTSEAEARRRVDAVLQAIAECLEDIATQGEPDNNNVRGKLSIVGFGNFVVKFKPGREYRNPQTGGTTEKPDTNVVTFKAGKFLRDLVN